MKPNNMFDDYEEKIVKLKNNEIKIEFKGILKLQKEKLPLNAIARAINANKDYIKFDINKKRKKVEGYLITNLHDKIELPSKIKKKAKNKYAKVAPFLTQQEIEEIKRDLMIGKNKTYIRRKYGINNVIIWQIEDNNLRGV